ncbi:carboxymuconolactone decarboxylase family protein [Undibacterium sp. Tian12W]|uniref:carboxymuconolactone decarboxylase family protein n=1 Tax=Undibacterium sp. Tian12W TaxID=3413054 RepID=UPI003BF05E9E
MSMPRIAPLEPPYDIDVEQAFTRIMPPGMPPLTLFRTQAHNKRVLLRMFAGNLLDKGEISLRARELLILRTCARCGSEYEWGVHVTLFAARAGLSKEDIAATLSDAPALSALSASELLLLKAVDELHETSSITDALWAKLEQHFSQVQLLEIISLVGSYHTVSFVTNAARIELETFAARFAQYQ